MPSGAQHLYHQELALSPLNPLVRHNRSTCVAANYVAYEGGFISGSFYKNRFLERFLVVCLDPETSRGAETNLESRTSS